jgi:hypothetical protein
MVHRTSCGCPHCRARRRHRAYELELAQKVMLELDEALDRRRLYESGEALVDDD